MTVDTLSQDFLDRINYSLPEPGDPGWQEGGVPEHHPEYLAEGNEINIHLLEDAEVWITFVHEGAGFKNALGFFVYDENNPPATAEDIDTLYIIFPNSSLENSGGGLQAGNKIRLKYHSNNYIFPQNTVIGWFLVQNGWNGTDVETDNIILYSEPSFNPEADTTLQQHNVLLHDEPTGRLVLGFEDLLRTGGDQDFNDALFYITSNPPEAIDTTDVATTDEDPPNPVVLSSFAVNLVEGQAHIHWITQTETNSLGWNIYRGENETDFANNCLTKINLGLISGAGTTSEPTEYNFIDEDNDLDSTNYWYWLENISLSGEREYYGAVQLIPEYENNDGSLRFGLLTNYPNPFNPSTEIRFRIKEKEAVDLSIYNIKGQKVKTLINAVVEPNTINKAIWDGTDVNNKKVSSGIYFYLLKTPKKNYMKKMLLRN